MSGDKNARISERFALAGIDGTLDRLSHELACLIDLGALDRDDQAALSGFLRDLRDFRSRIAWGVDRDGTRELESLARALAADLDLAYMRLAA